MALAAIARIDPDRYVPTVGAVGAVLMFAAAIQCVLWAPAL